MPVSLQAAYITTVQRASSESYRATEMANVIVMDNPAQRFVATLEGGGLSVTPDEQTWRFSLRGRRLGAMARWCR